MNILLTGGTGFVGSRIAGQLSASGEHELTCAVRMSGSVQNGREVQISGLSAETDWRKALGSRQQVVIHAAARAHVMNELHTDPMAEYRRVNVDGTLKLARQAAEAGVKRFIYLSSIKVNGERTIPGQPFTADAEPAPEDAYGLSKLEAETGLKEIASETGMDLVIIRPPLVYGPGVKGSFATMINLVRKGLPLPLGRVHNKRSLVALDTLVDLILTCIDHPAAANEVFLVSDGQDVSTTELLKGIGTAMGKPTRLIPIASSVLMLAATLLGKKAVAQRLLGSLQVDISKTRSALGWEPPLSFQEGMYRCLQRES